MEKIEVKQENESETSDATMSVSERLNNLTKLYDEGKTKVKYPNGRHNDNPSRAVDIAPYPIDWADRERFHLFAGFVLGIARSMGIKLRWGGDWNMNFEVDDNKFDDFPHFEIKE